MVENFSWIRQLESRKNIDKHESVQDTIDSDDDRENADKYEYLHILLKISICYVQASTENTDHKPTMKTLRMK